MKPQNKANPEQKRSKLDTSGEAEKGKNSATPRDRKRKSPDDSTAVDEGRPEVTAKRTNTRWSSSDQANADALAWKRHNDFVDVGLIDRDGKPRASKSDKLPNNLDHRRVLLDWVIPVEGDDIGDKVTDFVKQHEAAHSRNSVRVYLKAAYDRAWRKYRLEAIGMTETEFASLEMPYTFTDSEDDDTNNTSDREAGSSGPGVLGEGVFAGM